MTPKPQLSQNEPVLRASWCVHVCYHQRRQLIALDNFYMHMTMCRCQIVHAHTCLHRPIGSKSVVYMASDIKIQESSTVCFFSEIEHPVNRRDSDLFAGCLLALECGIRCRFAFVFPWLELVSEFVNPRGITWLQSQYFQHVQLTRAAP